MKFSVVSVVGDLPKERGLRDARGPMVAQTAFMRTVVLDQDLNVARQRIFSRSPETKDTVPPPFQEPVSPGVCAFAGGDPSAISESNDQCRQTSC